MKKAKFITSIDSTVKKGEKLWITNKFNDHSNQLESFEGILNVKRAFLTDPERTVKKVSVRATALGIFDMFINGVRIGNKIGGETVYDELKPGWTDYRFRVFEYEYDITEYCRGANLFTAEVSPGWCNSRISFGFYKLDKCAFAGEIEIEYTDGETEIIASDKEWQASVCGPVLRADMWDGEYYDATIPRPCDDLSAHRWINAEIFDGFKGKIVPLEGPAVRVKKQLTRVPQSAVIYKGTVDNGTDFGAINVISKKTGASCELSALMDGESQILDMGQNMVGRPVLRFKAPKGTKIEVFFAEMLNDSGDKSRGNDGAKGSMYISNYRAALARIVYIASGEAEEEFFPVHVFYGFRYLEIRADRGIEIISVKGEVIGSDITEASGFVCDNQEVNQLYSNILWGMRGNYLSIPTDCPQRDERLGWTGDTHIFSGAASYIADIDGFMNKWLGDARDSQQGYEGAYCDIIPRVFDGFNGNAAWGDAGLIVPYRLWLMYNDTGVIAKHYDSMEQYMQFLSRYGLEGANLAYGDWLNYDVTDKRYIAVSYYANAAMLMTRFSEILGKTDRAEYYRELHEKIVSHWREKYIENGEFIFKTQTAYLLALAFELLPENMRDNTVTLLKKAIVENDYTLSTGFVGTGILNQTLARFGLDDICYDLLLQTKDPSWLYSVRQGATTVWERWNSYTIEKGFGDVSMNSFNHYAYGAVAEWMYSGMCGIVPDEKAPGFSHFVLRPTPDMRRGADIPDGQKNINFASAYYGSYAGKIESGWSRDCRGGFVYSFSIPEGSSASVEIICKDDTLEINGVSFELNELSGRRSGKRVCFELGAGKYTVRA